MTEIASTPTPPYYAVIFTSFRKDSDNGYAAMSEKMIELAKQQPGFLGMESARDGLGITISYWSDTESIKAWHGNAEHQLAQKTGYQKWYQSFKTRVCKVERDYGFERGS